MKNRCFGNKKGEEIYARYHDDEWGREKHSENELFEMLILEGAQAGLSWLTILKKREGYRKAFKGFDPVLVGEMNDEELELLIKNSRIVRNRLKIYSTRRNAKVFMEIQNEFGTFNSYIWKYVNFKQVVNSYKFHDEVPVKNALSELISKDLKKRGMSFIGPTIIYSFMESIGMIDNHLVDCHLRNK